ncbi:MAG TPA: hypothetical protein VF212_17835 [Longimicrobiales bacterium]
MNGDRERRPLRGDALRRALREAAPRPPLEAVDWDRLHARVMAGARQLGPRAGARRRWWDVAAAWASRGVPITATAAAAAAAVLALGGSPTGRGPAGGPSAGGPPPGTPAWGSAPAPTLEEWLAADAGPLLADAAAEDALARALLSDEREEP